MDNLFIQNYRHPENLFKPQDHYIAVCFLKELIAEWDRNQVLLLAQQKQAELVAIRLAGRLPYIDINGTDFTIDLRLQELRETESSWSVIDLSELSTALDSNDYEFFYNTVNHAIWQFEDDITEMPENVVMVTLPDDTILDPLAAARSLGYDERQFLDEYPILENLKTGIKPLEQTFFPYSLPKTVGPKILTSPVKTKTVREK